MERCERLLNMADPATSVAVLEDRVARLTDVVNKLIGVVSRLDDETADTAAAGFNKEVPRVAGHKATADELKSLNDTLDSWQKESGAGKRG
jgi:phosphohistidine swiveling domain-containing protein